MATSSIDSLVLAKESVVVTTGSIEGTLGSGLVAPLATLADGSTNVDPLLSEMELATVAEEEDIQRVEQRAGSLSSRGE